MQKNKRVYIVGNVISLPQRQHSPHHHQPCSFFNLSTNRFSYYEGHWIKTTYQHQVLVKGPCAKACEKYLTQGLALAVEGILQTAENNNLIIAEDIHFLGLRTMILTNLEAPKTSRD